MTEGRLLQLLRIALGAFFVWRAWDMLGAPQEAAEPLALSNAWRAWPLVGDLTPLALTFTVAVALFSTGVFLAGGLLVRLLSLMSLGMVLGAFVILGSQNLVLHLIILAASAVLAVRGGGRGTMDAALGAMQRRSIEREAAREAERRAERSSLGGTNGPIGA